MDGNLRLSCSAHTYSPRFEGGHAAVHFFGGNLFDGSRDGPAVAKRIDQRRRTVAVELEFQRAFDLRPVEIFDVKEDENGRAADGLRAEGMIFPLGPGIR